jgi:hypothetical protein
MLSMINRILQWRIEESPDSICIKWFPIVRCIQKIMVD